MLKKISSQPENIYLELPAKISLKVGQEDFEAISAINSNLRLERTSEGELIVSPPTGGETGKRNLRITTQLGKWVETHEELGEAFDSGTGFRLPNGSNLSPDASWVSRERWYSFTMLEHKSFIPLCPDFVIELRSESDSIAKLRAKMQEYIDNGTRLGWLIDPQNRRVEIYRSRRDIETLENPSQVCGEDVLLGFVLNLERIFAT